jgi:hypothetical protein
MPLNVSGASVLVLPVSTATRRFCPVLLTTRN